MKKVEKRIAGIGGVLSKIKLYLSRNRLGELLVENSHITSEDLGYALKQQKISDNKLPLGRVLLVNNLVTRRALYGTLFQQATIRCLAGAFSICVAVSGSNIKSAKAGNLDNDVSWEFTLASAKAPYNERAASSYPEVFGASGYKSRDMKAFTKWNAMFDHFENSLDSTDGSRMVSEWGEKLNRLKSVPIMEMASKVNSMMNAKPYVEDINNWGVSDYWADPVEFNKRGGDCEDFAIAKYIALRALGVPEDNLRLAIVHDMQRDIPHAVLILFAKGKSYVLDNQSSKVKATEDVKNYFPIYSINQQAWWLHNRPEKLQLAMAGN